MPDLMKNKDLDAEKTMETLLRNKVFSPGRHEKLKGLLTSGEVAGFREVAGIPYTLSGTVVEGNRVGRTLGYPTANLKPDDQSMTLPGQGVYAALVSVLGKHYESMVNVGIRPTLDLENVTIEAHIFDFNQDIYGKHMEIVFLERMRDEMRFNSLSELKMQLDKDARHARSVLQETKLS